MSGRTSPRRSARGGLLMVPLVALGVVGGAVYWHFTEKDRVIAEQRRIIGELAKKLDRAWASELVADMRVNRVTTDVGGKHQMDLTFVQYQPGSQVPVLKKSFTLPGDEFYVDALVVQFDRQFVDEGDALRGRSLLLFRRAFGDQQKPVEGVTLFRTAEDSPIPEVARVDATPSAFEQEIWTRFWDYASDAKQAAAAGIRVAQGEAPHVKAVAGQVYKLSLRASGGLEITPRIPDAVLDSQPPAAAAPR